ncbi:hypothetical protein ACFPUZ_04540, partial [Corynebacterium nasicanis]
MDQRLIPWDARARTRDEPGPPDDAEERSQHPDVGQLEDDLPADLVALLADGLRHAELVGAFHDRQAEGVDDAPHGNNHAACEQRVDEGEQPVDLRCRLQDAVLLRAVEDTSERLLRIADKPPFLATMPRGKHITETLTVR